MGGTEPGWFRDPHDRVLARWHDGHRFTEHTVLMADHRDGPPPPPAWSPPLASSSPSERRQRLFALEVKVAARFEGRAPAERAWLASVQRRYGVAHLADLPPTAVAELKAELSRVTPTDLGDGAPPPSGWWSSSDRATEPAAQQEGGAVIPLRAARTARGR